MKSVDLPLDIFAINDYVQRLGHKNIPAYQKWFGLKPDGVVGQKTSSLLMTKRCGNPDFSGRVQEAQWPRSCMKVPVSYEFDRISSTLAKQAWEAALGKWNEVCGIQLDIVEGLRNGKIWATDGPLPGGTLAWSFLANDRCDDRLEQRYDTEEVPYQFEFLTKIIFHEVGHALGLEHSNNQADIMYPSISNTPWSAYPSQNDIARVVQRYGQPTDPPDPPPPPTPTNWTFKEGFIYICDSNGLCQWVKVQGTN